MTFFEKELRTMFGDTDIIKEPHFVGKAMLGKIDDDLRVKVEFIATHTTNNYDALRLHIINRTEGTVDAQTFKFADLIGMQSRQGREKIAPHIWAYNQEVNWYIPISQQQKAQIADSVLTYAEMYQDQSMAMGGMQM